MASQQRTTEQGAGAERGSRDAAKTSQTNARDTEGARGESERSIPTADDSSRQQQSSQAAPARRGAGGSTVTRWPGFFPPSTGIPVTPWDLMRRMSDEIAQVLQALSSGPPGTGLAQRNAGTATQQRQQGASSAGTTDLIAFTPQIEVQERPDAIVVRADLPGVDADDVVVNVDEGVLTIQGERRQEERDERDGVVRTERIYGAFFRAIPLPEGADADRVDATFRNGVLEIAIPVSRRQSARRVNVRS
jgi:HSP20 family protein